MNFSPNNIPEKFTVEQAYVITMLFFLKLWEIIQSKITEKERIEGVYELFFIDVCSGDECHAEWNEAVRLETSIVKEKQKSLYLTLPQIFSCALAFCKLHNRHYNSKINYAVELLESMKEHYEKHPVEWEVWDKAVKEAASKHMKNIQFDWADQLSI